MSGKSSTHRRHQGRTLTLVIGRCVLLLGLFPDSLTVSSSRPSKLHDTRHPLSDPLGEQPPQASARVAGCIPAVLVATHTPPVPYALQSNH